MSTALRSFLAGSPDVRVSRNVVVEILFRLPNSVGTTAPHAEVRCRMTSNRGGTSLFPAFWRGGDTWAFRFASPVDDQFDYAVEVAGAGDVPARPAGVRGAIRVEGVDEGNPLLRRGPVRVRDGAPVIEHQDGTPFFLLADSWWHGMTARLPFEDFAFLVKDRRETGFNAIQFAIANPCDVAPFDERAANEAGQPWTADYGEINPRYFDFVDRRILHLVEQGLLPMIVGSWGYYIGYMGVENMKRHWRYLYARYAAFPCMLTLCGESKLPWYGSRDWGTDGTRQTAQWTEVMRYLRGINVFKRAIGVHPGPDIWHNKMPYEPLNDMSLVDVYYGMGGHGANDEWENLTACVEAQNAFRAKFPQKPSLVGECLFEGMMGGGSGPKIQRALFWLSVLSGAMGHCYGADALWQMNSRKQPFGVSGFGRTWGNYPWEEAYQWEGSRMVAVGRRIMERFEWWRFESHPEWVSPVFEREKGYGLVAAAAGIPGEVHLFYQSRRGVPMKIHGLDPKKAWKVTFIDPRNGDAIPSPYELEWDDNGDLNFPRGPVSQDWLVAIEPA